MQQELLFDVQFYAFLNGYVKSFLNDNYVQMSLRMKNIEEKIKQAIDKFTIGQIGGNTVPGGLPLPQQGETDEQRKVREEAERLKAEAEAQKIIQENLRLLEEEKKR